MKKTELQKLKPGQVIEISSGEHHTAYHVVASPLRVETITVRASSKGHWNSREVNAVLVDFDTGETADLVHAFISTDLRGKKVHKVAKLPQGKGWAIASRVKRVAFDSIAEYDAWREEEAAKQQRDTEERRRRHTRSKNLAASTTWERSWFGDDMSPSNTWGKEIRDFDEFVEWARRIGPDNLNVKVYLKSGTCTDEWAEKQAQAGLLTGEGGSHA